MRKTTRWSAIVACLAVLALTSMSQASTVLFFDDFEGGNLEKWTGKNGGTSHHGVIETEGGNSFVSFEQAVLGGDIFQSGAVSTPIGQRLILSFDYRGTGEGESGGYIGIASEKDSSHAWLAGTGSVSSASPVLRTDGEWHHYQIHFNSKFNFSRVMLEDFVSPGYNASFDNVQLAVAPVPAAAWAGMMLIGGMGGLTGLKRKLRRA